MSDADESKSAALFDLTTVEQTFIEKRVENWIRFGQPASDKVLDRRRRLVSFAPGSVFAFVRWTANEYGTVASHIDIVRAVEPGEAFETVPFVRPGGELLLDLSGWPKVRRVFEAIDAIEAMGIDAAEVCPDHWRCVSNRIKVGMALPPYTPLRHKAWLKRRRLLS